MFRFRTNHQPPRERRDGFVSFRCFLWLEEEEGRGIGEEENGNLGGRERDSEEDGRGL